MTGRTLRAAAAVVCAAVVVCAGAVVHPARADAAAAPRRAASVSWVSSGGEAGRPAVYTWVVVPSAPLRVAAVEISSSAFSPADPSLLQVFGLGPGTLSWAGGALLYVPTTVRLVAAGTPLSIAVSGLASPTPGYYTSAVALVGARGRTVTGVSAPLGIGTATTAAQVSVLDAITFDSSADRLFFPPDPDRLPDWAACTADGWTSTPCPVVLSVATNFGRGFFLAEQAAYDPAAAACADTPSEVGTPGTFGLAVRPVAGRVAAVGRWADPRWDGCTASSFSTFAAADQMTGERWAVVAVSAVGFPDGGAVGPVSGTLTFAVSPAY